MITVVPDLDIGIHTSITGPDTGYKISRNLHMYILDLLMHKEPWLNITDACTFPDSATRKFFNIHKEIPSVLPLISYVGTYRNYGYGNISVILPEKSSQLRMLYGDIGKWNLYPAEMAHHFVADGLDDVWNMDLSKLWFEMNAEDAKIDKLVVASFESRLPPVFIRDLKMSKAPHNLLWH